MIDYKPHQTRVIEERDALNEKLDKLEAFFKTPLFDGLDEAEQKRLSLQSIVMARYSDVLSQRIAAFK